MAKPSRMDALGMTAWWTAAARARENERQDRLFDDPYAADLAGLEALEEFDRTTTYQGPRTGDLQAICTRFFDEFLLHVTRTHGIRQVVLLGAGLDVRAFRLSWPPETDLFELDQAQILEYKERKLATARAAPACARRLLGVDLTVPYADALCRAGFDPRRRSVWLLEGFLYFLPETAVWHLLDVISELAVPDSWIGLDVVNSDMLSSPWTKYWIESMAGAGTPWLFSSDEPEDLLTRYGWRAAVKQPGEEGADFGRIAYPVTPRSLSGIPRTLLVTAVREKPLHPGGKRERE
jgi:methyltransferase (TIGR00027 family)